MPDVFLLGLPEDIEALAPDDPPDEVALCRSAGPLHREARLPLYALIHGLLLDEAASFEFLVRALAEEGPFLLGVDPRFSEKLATLEDDAIETLMAQWRTCAAIEELELDSEDLLKFLFELVNLCKIRDQDSALELFIYHEG